MKYVVLREHNRPARREFTDMVAGGPDAAPGLPFQVETEEMSAHKAAEVRGKKGITAVIPSMPFSLIAPVPAAQAAPPATQAWGVEAVGALNSPFDGKGVTVAVLDTGIDRSHPAFAGVRFDPDDLVDFIAKDKGVPGVAEDTVGHGTHVAGTILGRDVDGIRIGIARGIEKLLVAKVVGNTAGSSEAVLNAIDWAQQRNADIITMSLGINLSAFVRMLVESGFPPDIAASRALEAYRSNVRVFDNLAAYIDARAERGRGALLVAASGNESRRGQDGRFTVAAAPPAAADGIIAVGAVARKAADTYAVADFSNTGCVLAAPGVDILSARRGGGLAFDSGTSTAAPHVAGVLALWTQKEFPGGERPSGWTRQVQEELKVHRLAGQARSDVGRGLVQAPGPED